MNSVDRATVKVAFEEACLGESLKVWEELVLGQAEVPGELRVGQAPAAQNAPQAVSDDTSLEIRIYLLAWGGHGCGV